MRADVHDGTFVDDKGRRELGHFTVRAVKRHAIEHGLGGVEGVRIQMPLVTRRRPGRLRRQCARRNLRLLVHVRACRLGVHSHPEKELSERQMVRHR